MQNVKKYTMFFGCLLLLHSIPCQGSDESESDEYENIPSLHESISNDVYLNHIIHRLTVLDIGHLNQVNHAHSNYSENSWESYITKKFKGNPHIYKEKADFFTYSSIIYSWAHMTQIEHLASKILNLSDSQTLFNFTYANLLDKTKRGLQLNISGNTENPNFFGFQFECSRPGNLRANITNCIDLVNLITNNNEVQYDEDDIRLINNHLNNNELTIGLDLSSQDIGGNLNLIHRPLPNLQILNLSTNNLTLKDIRYLTTTFISNNTDLKALNLHQCNVTSTGALLLANLFYNNISLTELNLKNNKIEKKVEEFLQQTWIDTGRELHKLYLNIKPLTIRPLLMNLNLLGCQIGPEGAQALARNTTLKSLYLESNKVKDAGTQALAFNTTLTTLYLSINQVEDAGAQALALNTTLTNLNLYHNKVGDAGAQALALNTTLTELDLSSNQVGDAGAQALALNTTLTELDLSSNQVGDAGAQALALNTTLTTLDLGWNQVGNAGAQALALNTTLTTLDLGWNQVGNAGAQALALNTTLTHLDLRNNQVEDAGALDLALNTTLTTLDLGWNQVGDAAAQALAFNTTLTHLDLRNNQVSDAGALDLALNTTLTELNLGNNQVGDAGARALARNTTLTELNLRDNHQVSNAGVQALNANTTLKNLYL